MIKKVTFIVCCFAVFVLLPAFLRAQHTDCLEQIKAYYRKTNLFYADSHPASLKYGVKTVMRDSIKYPASSSGVEIRKDGSKLEYLSKEMEMHQDAENTVVIVPGNKAVYISPTLVFNKDKKAKDLQLFQDTLFKIGRIKACKAIKHNKEADKEVVMTFGPDALRLLAFTRIVFYINTRQQTIHKVVLHYPEKLKVARVEVTFENLNTTTDLKLSEDMAAQFLDSAQQMVSHYKGYKLTDLRKHKS